MAGVEHLSKQRCMSLGELVKLSQHSAEHLNMVDLKSKKKKMKKKNTFLIKISYFNFNFISRRVLEFCANILCRKHRSLVESYPRILPFLVSLSVSRSRSLIQLALNFFFLNFQLDLFLRYYVSRILDFFVVNIIRKCITLTTYDSLAITHLCVYAFIN